MDQTTRLNDDAPAPPIFQDHRNPETPPLSLAEYDRALAAAETLQADNAKLLAELTALKTEHARICENGRKIGEICVKYRDETDALKSQNETLHEENNQLRISMEGYIVTIEQAQRITIHSKGLQAAVDALNAERELLQPLVAVGVATRLRFLEKGKSGLSAEEIQSFHNIVRNGNQAGHCGNIIADTVIFKANLLDPNYSPSLSTAFEKLYRTSPTDFINTPRMHIRAENLLATLAANYAPPSRSQDEVLHHHWENLGSAWEEYGALLLSVGGVHAWIDGEIAAVFDSSEEVCELVVKMEKIGGDIITRERAMEVGVVKEEE